MSISRRSSTETTETLTSNPLKPFAFFAAILIGAALPAVPVSAAVTSVNFAQSSIAAGGVNNGASHSIVSGDFNNDGILDLVTINESSLSFYKGKGGGKYAPPVSQTLPTNTGAGGPVFAADFNGDGKLDVASAYGPVCCGENGSVTILLGNGDGTFTQGTNIAVSTDSGPANASTIALADFNGDHKPDIAVSDVTSGYTWVFLGNGDGTFTQSAFIGSNGGGNVLVAGDFNGDGKQDLAFADTNYAGLYLGDGKGGFPTLVEAPLSGVSSLAVGDFYNTHSSQSLVALAGVGIPEDNGVYTYIYSLRYANRGLLIENSTLISGGNAEGPTYVTGGDLNGDFNFDIFISGGGYYSPAISEYMLGNGNGMFGAPEKAPHTKFADSLQFPFIRDLNLDSRHDVAMVWDNIPDDNGGEQVLLNSNATPNCDPPPANALGINVCAPANGQTVGSTFTFKAAGNAFNGIAQRMELFVDGKKVAEFLEDQLQATVSLSAGKHAARFMVVDSFGNSKSMSVSFTAE